MIGRGETPPWDEPPMTTAPPAAPRESYPANVPAVKYPPSVSLPPAGVPALCRDGTVSYSGGRRGACSYHGGLAR